MFADSILHPTTPEDRPRVRPLSLIPGIAEIAVSGASSLITTSYILQRDSSPDPKTIDTVIWHRDPTIGSLITNLTNPSPEAMLGGCIFLGISISSFYFRHQKNDSYQDVIFLTFILIAVIAGIAAHVQATLILLGFVPWAAVAAMFVSGGGHLLRRHIYARRQLAGVEDCGEKGRLVEI